jgi:Tol biopolymer transport system component
LDATKNGEVLATQQYSNMRDLWIVPNNDSSKAKQITSSGEFQGKFSLMIDGRILTSSEIGGARDIWILNSDAGTRVQLTRNQGSNIQPEISFDGKHIVFISDRMGGVNHVFVMDTDGANVKQLTNGENEVYPVFSSDDKWVYYVEVKNDLWTTIKRVPITGGEASVLVTAPDGWHMTGFEANRKDGRLMYGLEQCSEKCHYKIGIVSSAGGIPKVIDVPASFIANRPHWTPDGRRIALQSIDGGIGRIIDVWSISPDGKGKPKQLTDFKTPSTNYFTWSPDGKQMLVSRGIFKLEPVLIRRSGI